MLLVVVVKILSSVDKALLSHLVRDNRLKLTCGVILAYLERCLLICTVLDKYTNTVKNKLKGKIQSDGNDSLMSRHG